VFSIYLTPHFRTRSMKNQIKRKLSILSIILLFISCAKDESITFSEPGQPSNTANLTVTAGYCDLSQTPFCRQSDWVGYAQGVQLFLYKNEESFEIGDYFRSCTTDKNGRCNFAGLPSGRFILFSKYEDITQKEEIIVINQSHAFHLLIYPFIE